MDRIFRNPPVWKVLHPHVDRYRAAASRGLWPPHHSENDRDRKMTIMTTTLYPCGAKLPIIALFAGALFGGASWVAPSAYFVGSPRSSAPVSF